MVIILMRKDYYEKESLETIIKILIKKLLLVICLVVQSSLPMQKPASIYNNARLIFHAIGPKFRLPKLEGIDPSTSIEAMET
jgi:hypothetical protein